MSARLVFLGRLQDVAGFPETTAPCGTLVDVLSTLDPALAKVLADDRIRLALNGVIVTVREGLMLGPGDELAFLPLVSGG